MQVQTTFNHRNLMIPTMKNADHLELNINLSCPFCRTKVSKIDIGYYKNIYDCDNNTCDVCLSAYKNIKKHNDKNYYECGIFKCGHLLCLSCCYSYRKAQSTRYSVRNTTNNTNNITTN